MFREGLKEGAAVAEQDRDLVEDHFIDEAGLQRGGQDAAAHEADVFAIGEGRERRRWHLRCWWSRGLPGGNRGWAVTEEHGVLERQAYDQLPRYEYVLPEKGTELIDLLIVMTGLGRQMAVGHRGPARALPP
ncbi:winged helix-turn-helix transcriptional regulator [Nocardia sp. CS682]|uniref:winged helix-turn-helix transcriptional regulator n=1 Tax=Nocardia sp. CS682 TaxID=1047172 RepID=UPI001F0E83EE|nr:winged helix-turn-helix transcriptional regulator [Nocardia sp. CS682]